MMDLTLGQWLIVLMHILIIKDAVEITFDKDLNVW